MIVIGADTHKRSYALAATDDGTGAIAGELETRAGEDGHPRTLRRARELPRGAEARRGRIRSIPARPRGRCLRTSPSASRPPSSTSRRSRFRLLTDHRDDLVAERTQAQNRLAGRGQDQTRGDPRPEAPPRAAGPAAV